MMERKRFVCGNFGYIAHHCKNRREIEESRRIENGRSEYQPSNNKFEVLTSRVINVGEVIRGEVKKDRKIVLREERLKKGKKEKISRSKKDKRKKVVERSNSENKIEAER